MAETVYQEPLALPDLYQDKTLNIDPKTGFEEWERLGVNVQRFARSHQWWVGDWLNFGDDKFGEEAWQAVDGLGFEPKTLSNWMRVALYVPADIRYAPDELSWSHHRIVAELPHKRDRQRSLAKAFKNGWTTRELQEYVNGLISKDTADEPEQEEDAVPPTAHTFIVSFKVEDGEQENGRMVKEQADAFIDSALNELGITRY